MQRNVIRQSTSLKVRAFALLGIAFFTSFVGFSAVLIHIDNPLITGGTALIAFAVCAVTFTFGWRFLSRSREMLMRELG